MNTGSPIPQDWIERCKDAQRRLDVLIDGLTDDMARGPTLLEGWTDEWVAKLERAGFEVERADARELDWNYEEWMGNQAVAPELAAELAGLIESAEGEARAQLHPERRDGKLWHAYWHALIRAHKPGT